MKDFFPNTNEVGSFDFEIEKKIRVSGKIFERWVQLLSRSIACGEHKKRVIERKIGITKTEREDLESLLKGRVGVKGIATIESQIRKGTGIEVKFEYTSTETEETTFKAPDCGRNTLIIYQLVREYDFTIYNKKIFALSKYPTRIILKEYTDSFHDLSYINKYDPACGCSEDKNDSDDGVISLLINGIYQILTPYNIKLGKVKLKNLNIEVSLEELGKMAIKSFGIKSKLLPRHIVFLSGLELGQVNISLNNNWKVPVDDNIRFDLPYEYVLDVPKKITSRSFKALNRLEKLSAKDLFSKKIDLLKDPRK